MTPDDFRLQIAGLTAQLVGPPAGWLICPPGSAHRPTVTRGRALVLYLLPEGRIDFTA